MCGLTFVTLFCFATPVFVEGTEQRLRKKSEMEPSRIDLDFDYDDQTHSELNKRGFVILPRFMTPNSLGWLSAHCQSLVQSRVEGLGPDRIINAHQVDSSLFALASHPQILDLIQRQIGPNILLWSTHLLAKEPRTGREIPPHQDSMYWDGTFPDLPFHLAGNFSASIWIPLTDATLHNGTMEMLPGSHTARLPFERFEFQSAQNETKKSGSGFGYQICPEAYAGRTDWEPYNMVAGQAALHHVLTAHR